MLHVTSTALLVRDGRVLLGRRTSRVRFAGMWDGFGGHLEPGESPEAALRREVREELGIEVTRFQSVSVYEDVDPTGGDTFRHSLFLVTDWAGEVEIANPEHSEIRWFPPAEVVDLDLAVSLKAAIARLLTNKA